MSSFLIVYQENREKYQDNIIKKKEDIKKYFFGNVN